MVWRSLQLITGVLILSTAVILIKASTTHPVVLTAVRLGLGSLLLWPLEIRERRRHAATPLPPSGWHRTWVPAIALSLHFISWAFAARLTAAAQASLIVNLVPVALPFFLWSIAAEKITRSELFGTVFAVIGILILSVGDAIAANGSAWGNLVCVLSMLLFALYLALGRRNRDTASLWLYVVPVYRRAALIAALIALPWWVDGMVWDSTREWLLVFAIVLGPTITGHSLINGSMRHFRGQVVSLTNAAQFVFAGALAWFIFNERPSASFYVAGLFVMAGIVVVVWATPSRVLSTRSDPVAPD